MLAKRKEEWTQLPEPQRVPQRVPLSVAVAQSRPYPSVRKQFLQLIMLAAALAMLITVHSAVMVRAGYDLVEMKAQAAKLEKNNDLLRLEIAKLKSPQRIQQIATSQLGMVTPQTAYYSTAVPAADKAAAGDRVARAGGILKISKAEASKGR
jgi:cell division protein FtsL